MADRDHACHVMASVESMRQDDFLCDFKIKAGTLTFNTHRVILAANSEYFRHLFSSNMKEVEDGCVTISNIERVIMQQCVDYMYTSFLNLNSTFVNEILEAANFLQIGRLEDACFRFIQDKLSPDNCLTVLNQARIFQNEAVEEAAETVIENNVETILASKQVLAFEKKDLRRFISFATPQTAWTAITTWSDVHETDFPDLAEFVVFAVFPFQVLLNDILSNPHVKKCDTIKSNVINAIFADPSIVKENLDTENCFLLKHLANKGIRRLKAEEESLMMENEEFFIDYGVFSLIPSRRIIDSFMQENFTSIISKVEFFSLAKEDLIPFLESPEVEPEESKWDAIIEWVQEDIELRGKDFIDLFRCLCLDKLSIDFLRETVRCEDLVKADTDCINLLVDALLNRPTAVPQDEQPTESDSDCDDSSIACDYVASSDEFEVKLNESGAVENQISAGTLVVRGPDWKWGDQDRNGYGVVLDRFDEPGWQVVRWDYGRIYNYRMGHEGKFDLMEAESTEQSSQNEEADENSDQEDLEFPEAEEEDGAAASGIKSEASSSYGRASPETSQEETGGFSIKHGSEVCIFTEVNGKETQEKGNVVFIGRLPGDSSEEVHVGIDLHNPVGNGTGLYHGKRLFYTKQYHAALVPLSGVLPAALGEEPTSSLKDRHAEQEEADPSDDQNPDQQDLQFPDNQKEEAAVASGTKSEEHTYVIKRTLIRGFGFTVIGGCDISKSSYSKCEERKGIRIANVAPGGPAIGLLQPFVELLRCAKHPPIVSVLDCESKY